MRSSNYNVNPIINALPSKMKNEILKEHDETIILYKELLSIIKSQDLSALTLLLPRIIANYIIVHHFCKSCKSFQHLFDKYQIEMLENGDQQLYTHFAKEWLSIYETPCCESYFSQ
jgi:hypothetical protein